jgi:hypothetical protein
MADNTTLNAGSGGDVIATDDIGGVKYQRVKVTHGADGSATDASATNALPVLLQAIPLDFAPHYSGASSTGQRQAAVDEAGAVVTRATVLTDEGTFRCNFANTGLAVTLGSVTISGATVTGTGFLAADVHLNDYFKLDADAETAWRQIESVDSDTQLTLVSSYVGGSSGNASRAIVQPFTGSGGSIAVGSGQLTLTSGTTNNAVTGVARQLDYAPIVARARVSVSQRIANQETHIGLEEDAATPRWFARFSLSGTTNTTVICETGRNPTGAPSASETEQTTVTLPNGATTATMRDYRVELLTESVRFYVDAVFVAEHVRVLPAQHDLMRHHLEVRNATSAASSTTVIADYMTGKNHNKLEVGVTSDTERIVAAATPVQTFAYSQAGTITINTDLLIIDCSQIRSFSIHCTSMGTSGVVTPAFSNDGTTWVGATMLSEVGATSTTFNAAVLRVVNVMGRFFRLRLTTGASGGTTTITVAGFQTPLVPIITTQPVSGTVTSNIGTGSLAAGTNLIGDVGVQYRANATGAGTVTSINCPATPAVQTIKGSAGRLLGLYLVNTNATIRWLKVYNIVSPTLASSTAAMRVPLPQNQPVYIQFPGGMAFGTAITCAVCSTASLTDGTGAVSLDDVTGFSVHA